MEINILKKISIFFLIIFSIIFNKKLTSNIFKLYIKKKINNQALDYIYRENSFNKSFNEVIKLKKVVYSALLGKYDKIRPFNLQKGFDYILFTDNPNINHDKTNWTILPLPAELNYLNISKIKKQRFIKLHPHLYFKNYNISIYIDSSFQIKGDLNEFLFRILSPKYNIYNFEHPKRNTIYQETFAVVRFRKEKELMAKFIRERYIKENFPDNSGLIEGCLIVRKHNEKDCIYMMNNWFEEISKYSHRDQLSFNYIIWKTGIKFKYISKTFALNYFSQKSHIKNL